MMKCKSQATITLLVPLSQKAKLRLTRGETLVDGHTLMLVKGRRVTTVDIVKMEVYSLKLMAFMATTKPTVATPITTSKCTMIPTGMVQAVTREVLEQQRDSLHESHGSIARVGATTQSPT